MGRSTKDGGEPAEFACGTPHLVNTILHTAFDMGRVRLQPALANISKLGEAKTIAEVG